MFIVCAIRNNRCWGGGAVSEGRHHNEGFPPQQCVVSAGHPAASGRSSSSGAAVHEARGPAALHTLREEGGIKQSSHLLLYAPASVKKAQMNAGFVYCLCFRTPLWRISLALGSRSPKGWSIWLRRSLCTGILLHVTACESPKYYEE